jgi:hypothetical protein
LTLIYFERVDLGKERVREREKKESERVSERVREREKKESERESERVRESLRDSSIFLS